MKILLIIDVKLTVDLQDPLNRFNWDVWIRSPSLSRGGINPTP